MAVALFHKHLKKVKISSKGVSGNSFFFIELPIVLPIELPIELAIELPIELLLGHLEESTSPRTSTMHLLAWQSAVHQEL